jgi:hypothetical protein
VGRYKKKKEKEKGQIIAC